MSANAETQHRRNGTKKRYVSYFCGTYGRSGRSVCSWHRIYELTLAKIVTAEIKAQAQAVTVNKAAVVDRLKRKIADYDEHRLSAVRQEIGKLRRRVQELEAITAKLYEDKYSGAVSESTFMVLTQKKRTGAACQGGTPGGAAVRGRQSGKGDCRHLQLDGDYPKIFRLAGA